MSLFFGLNEKCFLICGAKRGAIYNLATGEVYSIDEIAKNLLQECENGKDAFLFLQNQPSKIREAAIFYLQELEKKGLGRFLGEGEKICKIVIPKPSLLEFIWLEVTQRCNLRCIHCYASSDLTRLHKEKMQYADWMSVIEQSYACGCRKLQFIGGEPFLLGGKLLDLVSFSRAIGYEFIEIYTNTTLINDEKLRFLAENGIAIATSLYGCDFETHGKITQKKWSFDKTVLALKKMIGLGIKVRVGVISMSVNEHIIDKTIRFLREDIGIAEVKLDFVRPVGRGADNGLASFEILRNLQKRQSSFPKCALEIFSRMKYGHNCFSGKICVTANGNLLPCIMARDIVLGNIFNAPLVEILEKESVKKIRSVNKDQIETCRDCEYRYCCFDCRPRAKSYSIKNDFFAKPLECLYNPYNGIWEKSE